MEGLHRLICVNYLNGVIIVGLNPTTVFDKLLEISLKPKARKCTLFATEVFCKTPVKIDRERYFNNME